MAKLSAGWLSALAICAALLAAANSPSYADSLSGGVGGSASISQSFAQSGGPYDVGNNTQSGGPYRFGTSSMSGGPFGTGSATQTGGPLWGSSSTLTGGPQQSMSSFSSDSQPWVQFPPVMRPPVNSGPSSVVAREMPNDQIRSDATIHVPKMQIRTYSWPKSYRLAQKRSKLGSAM